MMLAKFLLQIQGFKFRMFHGLHNQQNYHVEVQLLSTLQQRLSFIIKRISHVQLQTLSFFLNSVVALLYSHPDRHSPVSHCSRLLTCGLQCLWYSPQDLSFNSWMSVHSYVRCKLHLFPVPSETILGREQRKVSHQMYF